MDILERAEEAYYERQAEIREMEAEQEAQRERQQERDERNYGICDLVEDTVDYVRNRF